MTIRPDYAVRELEQLRLELRRDLRFSLQTHGGVACYVVEDPLAGSFYRIGLAEFELMAELNGKRDLATALRRCSTTLQDDALTLEEAGAVCRWLLETGLASTPDSRAAAVLLERSNQLRQESIRRRFHPLFFKIPLVRPNGWLRGLAPWAGHGLSKPAILCWLLVVILGVGVIVSHWATFQHELARSLLPHHWLWLGLTWILLRLVHETAHGAVCRYHGGEVPEGGLLFILGMPIPYLDVTSSWRFPRKWHRITVAAAGMYVEVFLAGLAALLWSLTTHSTSMALFQYVIVSAGFTTLLFNLNVLMRFDGYYILADWLEIPNLYSRGKEYLTYLYRRYFLGLRVASPLEQQQHAGFVRAYAFAALFWRWGVILGLLSAAVAYFGEIGWVLVGLTFLVAIILPGRRLVRGALFGTSTHPPRPFRFWVSSSVLLVILILGASVIRWPWGNAFPAVVAYADPGVVRNESPGFVTSVDVRDGEWVTEGTSLLQLENRELSGELADLQNVREQILLHRRRDLRQGNLAVYQARAHELEVVDHQIALLETRVAALNIQALQSGRVVGMDIESLAGRYLEAGTELMWIVDDRKKELLLVAERADSAELPDRFHSSEAWIWGGPTLELSFPEFEPRATREVPHPALVADAGGPLATQIADLDKDRDGPTRELVSPAFRGRIPLPMRYSAEFHVGRRATVWTTDGRTVADRIWNGWLGNIGGILRSWSKAWSADPSGDPVT